MRPVQVSAEHKKREAAQAFAVRKRDFKNGKPCCRFERDDRGLGWTECGKVSATDTAHILPRRECAKVWDAPEVALLACRSCHNNYDGSESTYNVRAPYAMAKAAWVLVVANSKVPPPARWDPDRNGLYEERAA